MASKRRLRRVACEGKIRYQSEEEASFHQRGFLQRTGHNLQPYKCQFCGCWHLGHNPEATGQYSIKSFKRDGR